MSAVNATELSSRLDHLTSQIASPEHSYHVLRPVTEEATKLNAFNSSGHARGLFLAAQNELYNMAAAIAAAFDSLVAAAYEPSRDAEIRSLQSHALERFDAVSGVLRSQLDSVLDRINSGANWGGLDEFESRKALARDELNAKVRTRVESARTEEKKAARGRRATAKYSAWTVVLSAVLALITAVGVQECFKAKEDKRAKIADQRFAVRLDVQRAMGPPLEAISSYLQILAASKPDGVVRSQALLAQNLRALDSLIPLQIPRIAFAYDSATVDSVFAVLGEFKHFYQQLDSSKTNSDSVERVLSHATDLSTRATSLTLRLGSYEK